MSIIPSAQSTLTAATTLLAAGAYLNARFGIGYDLRVLRDQKVAAAQVIESVKRHGPNPSLYRYLELADPKADAIWFEGQTLTFGELKEKVDVLALYIAHNGVKCGQVVGVFCTNSPEMAILMFAISAVGAVSSLLNTALKGETLTHCIKVSQTDIVIATPDLIPNIPPTIDDKPLKIFSLNMGYISPLPSPSPQGPTTHTPITPQSLLNLPSLQLTRKNAPPYYILIFTSGTTGFPKAVQIPRIYLPFLVAGSVLDHANPSKYFPLRTYSSLPLFHGTALLGFIGAMSTGSCFCIGRRFSATSFSRDLYESSATRVYYVGEICRYLLAAPPSPYDTKHQVIVALGNGLAGDVWSRFQSRFQIPEIREVYRSSEGLYRYDNFFGGAVSVGKVGFKGLIARWIETDTFLLRFDPETQDLYRDPVTGFCELAKAGEAGEAVARIQSTDTTYYPAYFGNKEATASKFARDVFKKGDLYQRSGDLLVRDSYGWISFLERIGESFRWKGENVSAGQVKGFICEIEGVHDGVVMGFRIQGYDGQLGTATIVLDSSSPEPESEMRFLEKLYPYLRERGLPEYAIPRLIRFTKSIETGATFKHAKEVLKKRSWVPGEGEQGDHCYYLDGKTYRKLDTAAWKRIEVGRARL